ncbi:DinB family protein [Brevibacillus sp. SYP-B805]|uniref:DinB family protein n=1 Tax=Brevibacillus sp. SYP-B805 TaxID=1578199 RepID=UPI0013EDDF9E|nr:DinB family protein [Brevibacillus sp. SYP-B805]NGQ97424.1 DinB family protein [Brevibacillus sp. SYP-B805]
MNSKQDVIEQFGALIPWVESLRSVDDSLWLKPIAEGKWSIGEIIAHLTAWGRFMAEERLPLMKPGAKLTFGKVDVQQINDAAAAYARSKASKEDVIGEFVHMREVILQQLSNIHEDDFFSEFLINEKPRTLAQYLLGMVEHDRHHRKQIDDFLKMK